MEAGILFALVLVLLFLGVPIAVALGLSSIIIIAFFSTDSMSSVALQLFTASQNYTLHDFGPVVEGHNCQTILFIEFVDDIVSGLFDMFQPRPLH